MPPGNVIVSLTNDTLKYAHLTLPYLTLPYLTLPYLVIIKTEWLMLSRSARVKLIAPHGFSTVKGFSSCPNEPWIISLGETGPWRHKNSLKFTYYKRPTLNFEPVRLRNDKAHSLGWLFWIYVTFECYFQMQIDGFLWRHIYMPQFTLIFSELSHHWRSLWVSEQTWHLKSLVKVHTMRLEQSPSKGTFPSKLSAFHISLV